MMKKNNSEIPEEAVCPACGHKHAPGVCCGDCGCCFEKRGYDLQGEEEEETEKSLWQLIVSFSAAFILLLFSFLSLHGILFADVPAWLPVSFCLAVYAYFGIPIILHFVKEVFRGDFFTESALMSFATIGALLLRDWMEAATVMFLYSVGETLSDAAFDRSKEKISLLLDLSEKKVRVLENGNWVEKYPEMICVNDTVSVHPGEKVTLDGIITAGESDFDTSGLTGESLPAHLAGNDTALSGYICLNGSIEMRVQKPYKESTASKLADAVTEAGKRKSKKEAFIRSFARYYTPSMMLLALLIFGIGTWISGNALLWAKKALTVLVISCPCALVLSVPLAYFSAIGAGAKKGILFKGGEAVDAAASVCAMAFDKTGTLTEGEIRVEKIIPAISQKEFASLAASALSHSSHPLAASFLKEYTGALYPVAENRETAGKGTKARLLVSGEEKTVCFGSARYLREEYPQMDFQEQAMTAVYGACNGAYIGCILFADTVKKGAKESIEKLKKLGVSYMEILSGDKKEAVARLACEVGIPAYSAQLLPEEKLNRLEAIIQSRKGSGTVAFAGDGLNDSAAIVRSDVGFAMGKKGAALSAEAADVVITNDRIENIPCAIRIAKKTKRTVWENIVFSLGVKLLILLFCLIVAPQMELAVLADVGVTVLAVLNCLKILKCK